MRIQLELHLEERRQDRVVVLLSLAPLVDDGAVVDGAAVQLVDAAGEALCPRVLVPVAGTLTGPLLSQVELRTISTLPEGAQVLATAWCGAEQVHAQCPTEPGASLRDHVVGAVVDPFDLEDVVLVAPSRAEREALEARLPWLAQPLRPADALEVIEVDDGPTAEELRDTLGLDDEDAAWLKELMDEP